MTVRLSIFFLAVLITVPASANEFNQDFRGGVDAAIINISTGGLWEQGDRCGNWCVVVINRGWEHARSFLYLQWITTDDEKTEMKELVFPVSTFTDLCCKPI